MKKQDNRKKEKISFVDMKIIKKKIVVLEANRQLSSKWTIALDIELKIKLLDGRILSAWIDKRIPARQIGRRKKEKAAS